MWTLDFETEAIEGNTTRFPPKPVGLAIRDPYWVTAYITDWEQMRLCLQKVWSQPLLFHNAKFDIAVAMEWFELPYPPNVLNVHDTQFLIFLHEPHAPSLSLKPSAERILGLPPEEQNKLMDWIIRNVPGATKKSWGAFICKAPKELVAPYAIGDVERTHKLFEYLMPIIKDKGMVEAYIREQQLLPILMAAEKRGLRVDIKALEYAIDLMGQAIEETDKRLFSLLNSTPFNLSSSAELAQALDKAGIVKQWVLTPTGARSTAKDALRRCVANSEVLQLLLYRGGMETCLTTFGEPWLAQAQREGGRLHPNWNQVRQEGYGSASKGTRTGRLSCDHPNLTNPPNEMIAEAPKGLPAIPKMRRFLLPEEGHKWIKRDFSSQEIRILAHYEDGALMEAYRANPELDPHQMAKDLIASITGMDLPRKDVKITAFATIYGAGASGLSVQLECDYARAKQVREAYLSAIPGIRTLGDALRNRGRNGLALKTWGGRRYLPEPPKLIKGVMRSFEYKLLNYLIQGSAADQTKQAIIDWDVCREPSWAFLAALHDEVNISVPEDEALSAMTYLKEVMNRDRFDVPMLSEGFIGDNFGELNALESE